MMMVIFQNKIIYMPSVPPFARSEKVDDYAVQCRPVVWHEHDLKSLDGIALKVLEGSMPNDAQDRVVVLYYQGNASSTPPRLPYLSQIIKAVSRDHSVDVSIVALSYRGFWKSKGKATQPGLEKDAAAAVQWVLNRYDESSRIVIWGQSIGTGVAALAVADLCRKDRKSFNRIDGLLLETPFVNMRALLKAMYPQKWLPYRYLTPFLRSTWEIQSALEEVADAGSRMKILLLQAENDEIVPDGQASILEDACRAKGLSVTRQVVAGALHQDIMMKPMGRKRINDFIGSFRSK